MQLGLSSSKTSSAQSTSLKPKSTSSVTRTKNSSSSAAQPTTSASIDPTKWYTLTTGNAHYLNAVKDGLSSINYAYVLGSSKPGMKFQFPEGLYGHVVSQLHTDKAIDLSADNKTWSTKADKSLVSTFGAANSRNVALAMDGQSVGGDGECISSYSLGL
ncbi:hypothetical protein C8R43DRAFT_1121681 [Mycena crocata]|nr:hypothetical protein C8R43DRAFT_1121681 [Mycena crocata]